MPLRYGTNIGTTSSDRRKARTGNGRLRLSRIGSVYNQHMKHVEVLSHSRAAHDSHAPSLKDCFVDPLLQNMTQRIIDVGFARLSRSVYSNLCEVALHSCEDERKLWSSEGTMDKITTKEVSTPDGDGDIPGSSMVYTGKDAMTEDGQIITFDKKTQHRFETIMREVKQPIFGCHQCVPISHCRCNEQNSAMVLVFYMWP